MGHIFNQKLDGTPVQQREATGEYLYQPKRGPFGHGIIKCASVDGDGGADWGRGMSITIDRKSA